MKNFHFGHRDQGIKQIPSKLQSIIFSSFFYKIKSRQAKMILKIPDRTRYIS
jgi:hypothetical protein